MDENFIDAVADLVIFIAGLSLLYTLAYRLYTVIEEMTELLIR